MVFIYVCKMFIDCNQLREKMDEAGKVRVSFLFGLNFEMDEGFFVENPLQQTEILFNVNGVSNVVDTDFEVPDYRFKRYPESFEVYQKRFGRVMDGLRNGETSLINLTVKTPIETSLSLRAIFTYSRAMYRIYVPDRFVCFSPERFVRVAGRKIFSHPMKGTIDANLPNASEILLNNKKELAEHNTIVELTCNDLRRVATGVKVNRFRYIDRLKTNNGEILQTSSEIEGTLPENYLDAIGSLFFKLLPAGSISGSPRESTLSLIREVEQEPRGFYSGVAGYFDGTNLDSAVLIRFIEQDDSKFYFRSGGGITIDSMCENEYREAVQKVYLPF